MRLSGASQKSAIRYPVIIGVRTESRGMTVYRRCDEISVNLNHGVTMKIELENLSQKFAHHRSRSAGKRTIYPPRLRKLAAALSCEHSTKTLASTLGVSTASIKQWKESFAPAVTEADLVAVEVAETKEQPYHKTEEIKVRIITIEVSLPSSDLAKTLADVIQGIGARSC